MKTSCLALVVSVLALACTSAPTEPDWGRPLPEGSPALLPLAPGEAWPDLAVDWNERDTLIPALERSIAWMKKASATTHFPIAGVTHERSLASLERFRELLDQSRSADDFRRRVESEFTVYKSAGWDGRGGGVLFTGYFTPILDGSETPDDTYRYPLYALPPDLLKDADGQILGQRTLDGGTRRYPSRRTIDAHGLLANKGLELVWLKSPLDAYIAHVNGSATIKLPGGRIVKFGYAGNNGHDYSSLREALVRDGKLDELTANLTSIRQWSEESPDEVIEYLQKNRRYVFFTPIEGNPRGSLNVEVTADRTLATDKALFPRGAVVFVDTRLGRGGSGGDFHKLMLDQDTGGAIRTAGRADIYLGTGQRAERLAGTTQAPGQLYYLFLDETRL